MSDIELLLAHADDQRPVLEAGLPLESAADEAQPSGGDQAHDFADFSDDPNDLSLQRWTVIAPEGPEGDALLALVAPLIRKREEDQGAPVVPYRVPAGMDAEAAIRWSKSVYHDESVALGDLPRYLLVLGDVDAVSLELQQVMASEALIGRLVSPSPAGYAAYVEKLLRWERAPSKEAQARALFFTAQDGTAATTIGHKALVAPSVQRCRDTRQKGGFKAREIEEIGYAGAEEARDAFLAQIARPEPSMLFTMSHGLGAPRRGWASADEQRAVQGAMSLGSGVRLAAEDIGDRPFLPGGIWFFLACYGGGTPAASAYHHWLSRLRDAGGFGGRVDGVLAGLPKPGDRPFIAALPQAALANPEGPLAVMAHIDLAWTYSFQDLGPDGKDRASRFEGIFSSLVKGARSGNAYNELLRYLGNANYELTTMYNQEARAEVAGKPLAPDQGRAKQRANLWMLREDLAGYVLLGDPAARLPLDRAKAAVKATPAPAEVRPRPVPVAAAAAVVPAVPAPARAREAARMQLAVHEKILGEEGDKKIAERHGITSVELQHALANDALTGRIHFADDTGETDLAGYAAYAEKVVRYAQTGTPETAPDLLFYVAPDGSAATVIGRDRLVGPSLATALEARARGSLPAASVREISAGCVDELLNAGSGARPSVLLSVSHGLGAPRRGWKTEEESWRRQGALMISHDEILDAERLRGEPFLPGGMWFYLACLGAGTPEASVYHAWLSQLAAEDRYGGNLKAVLHSLPASGQRPFVAALPQAALANPAGPLAVIGHVDLAWTYGFSGTKSLSDSKKSRIYRPLEVLVRGSRAGIALEALMEFYRGANDELSQSYQIEADARAQGRADPTERAGRAHLWMLRNDLRGYVLLGDPAARLPLEQLALRAKAPLPAPAETRSGAVDTPAISTPARESAVLAMIRGDEAPRAIAAGAAVSLETLWTWVDTYRAGGRGRLGE